MKISALSIVPILASSALLLSTGCGGDDISCGTAACGGDPVGTWNIEGVCFNAEIEPPEECPEARITTDFDITGTLTVNADETYTIDGETSSNVELVIPGSCLVGITSCDQLEGQDGDISCSGTPETSCSCIQSFSESADEQGTWMTSGNQLSLDGDEPGDYCVDGNTMSIHLPSGELELEILLTK